MCHPPLAEFLCSVCRRPAEDVVARLWNDCHVCRGHSWPEIVDCYEVRSELLKADLHFYREHGRHPSAVAWASRNLLDVAQDLASAGTLATCYGVRILLIPHDVHPGIFACDDVVAESLLSLSSVVAGRTLL